MRRILSLFVSLIGAIINLAFAIQFLSAWRSLRWEPESEWEGSENGWRVDGVKLVWGLLSGYFVVTATICVVGVVGIVKRIPSYVRFYRDYCIADFSFCTLFTLSFTYASFRRTSVRTFICEQLSRQPDLMRDMAEMGLSIENCELWFEKAVGVMMMGMLVHIIIRLHFLIALSNYYTYLLNQKLSTLPTHIVWRSRQRSPSAQDSAHHQHIYLLPRPTSVPRPEMNEIMVYAPVPLNTLSMQQREEMEKGGTEAWISKTERRSHRSGRIALPVREGEGLLPMVGKA